uniref:Uncharacterized protein n=1 Tax=Anguilla anguilla TaxID=7936 RepID=A0A0E9XP59_ANGAN
MHNCSPQVMLNVKRSRTKAQSTSENQGYVFLSVRGKESV